MCFPQVHLTYLTLPWWHIVKDILETRESSMLTFWSLGTGWFLIVIFPLVHFCHIQVFILWRLYPSVFTFFKSSDWKKNFWRPNLIFERESGKDCKQAILWRLFWQHFVSLANFYFLKDFYKLLVECDAFTCQLQRRPNSSNAQFTNRFSLWQKPHYIVFVR